MGGSDESHTSLLMQQWGRLDDWLRDEAGNVVLSGKGLEIPDIVFVSRNAGNVSIDQSALQGTFSSHNKLMKTVSEGEVVYGVNTGFGGSADTRTNDFIALQRLLTRELSYGVLSPATRDPRPLSQSTSSSSSSFDLAWEEPSESHHLPLTWVRAAILLRINSLIKGHSGVRPVILDRLHSLLSYNIIPMIPLRGSISASGDLSPLAYISGAIQGKSTIRILRTNQKQDVYADEALAEAGLEPVSLMAKEGLAIVNGTAISTAAATLILHDTHQLALLSQILTAMSVEALLGSPESFNEFFGKVRSHPGQIESSRNISAFLRGSQLSVPKDGKDGSLRQDRYSIRTAAQWIGPVLEDLLLAHQQITIECNSATDNPLIDDDGNVLHGGNFQAKAVTSAMEKCRQGIQSIGRMIYTQCREMINPTTSWGLPPNLVVEEPSRSAIFKAIDIHIAALTSELGFLAGPVNHVYGAEMGNQSLNSLALISARYTAIAARVLTELAAAHILSLCQAFDLRAMRLLFLDRIAEEFKISVSTLETDLQLQSRDQRLSEVLWVNLQKSLDQTVTMDSEERFLHIAKSMRVPILDHVGSAAGPTILVEMDSLIAKISHLLYEGWIINREAYMAHGDAKTVLGAASKLMYQYVRETLGIPFLYTARIMTPIPEDLAQAEVKEAPTLGVYTSILYRAIRRGELVSVMSEIIGECLTDDALNR
ncbi:L-Aspartase-like protein [Penicillium malachiteum]|nr:L-Aspartase-like protein [Penicillium malachiteum]